MENPVDRISEEGRSFDHNPPAPPPPPSDNPTVEIPNTFKNLIKKFGYPEAEFVMQAGSLLDKEGQNFLLLPMQETKESISLADEEQKKNQIIPVAPSQIWSFKKNDSLRGFALINVGKGAIQQGPERLPREIPSEFKDRIVNLGYSKPIFLVQWKLSQSDLRIGRQGTYFFIPLEKFNGLGFLTEQQKKDLGNGSKLDATLILPLLGESTTTMIRWKWDNWHAEEFLYTYALSGWGSIVEQFKLSMGTRIQVWTFSKGPDNIGFAVVIADADKVEELKKERVIPEEINNRIMGFGGQGLIFVMEMTFLTDVGSSVDSYVYLRHDKVENKFLTDKEMKQVKRHDGIDAVLIGPSIEGKDDKEFKVKLRFPGTLFFEFWGAGWNDFVTEYGLKLGQRMRIWSFRRPSATAGSHLGKAGSSEIGFALVLLDQYM